MATSHSSRIAAVVACAFTLLHCCSGLAGPLEPAAALADFQLPTGYRIELVAAEPEVVDPIAIAFDEDGRLWVVEMRDYPLLEKGAKPASRIRVLADRDGDGRYEGSTVFADGLLFPTGLQPWRGGVFVTLAGEIAYFPDDDRDNRADRKETWYQGFATGNEQLRANHPQLATDGWVYVAGGLRGGTIRNVKVPGAPDISINGRDFAFHPVTGACRAVSGNGQFGLTFDDFGRRFTCSNRNPLMQVMIEQRYLEQNPRFVLPRVTHDVAAAGAASRIFSRTRALTTSLQHAGQFTAACGVEIFRGDALPTDAYGNAFICEPTANLVHRERIEHSGAEFTSQPVGDGVEFLSATDEWFRPVNLSNGPDGALYVVDMYRAIIEHPEWMPEEWRDRPDMRDGSDRGRIWRIVAADAPPQSASQRKIESRDPAALAQLLAHPNSWRRETAARLLLELGDAVAVTAELEKLAADATDPRARYQALSALQMLGAISSNTALKALSDPSPGVRELALILAESLAGESPAVATAVMHSSSDADARVRYQAALSLSTRPSHDAAAPLFEIAARGGDVWTRRAVALAARDQAAAIAVRLLTPPAGSSGSVLPVDQLQELIDAVIAESQPAEVARLLGAVRLLSPAESRRLVIGVATALQAKSKPLGESLVMLRQSDPDAYAKIAGLFDDALGAVANPVATEAQRVAAAALAKFDGRSAAFEPLMAAAEQQSTPAVQLAAIDALRLRTEPALPERILAAFADKLPSVRQAMLDLLVSKPDWATALLHAAAEEQLALTDIGATRAQLLTQHADESVRLLAKQVLGAASQDRQAVIDEYQAALKVPGEPRRGKAVFIANCSSCHRVAGEGTAVGPDIGDAAMKPAPQLLSDILDPNRAVDANFVSYTALTLDGLAHQGIIKSETDGGVVLLTAEGKTVTILRDELDSLTANGSLMPEGLERQLTIKQMADLLAFLKMWRHAEDLAAGSESSHELSSQPSN